jgi:hypothetical protein
VLSSAANCLALGWLLTRRIGSGGWRGVPGTAWRAAAGTVVMMAAARAAHDGAFAALASSNLPAKAGETLSVGAGILAGLATYAAAMALLAPRAIRRLVRRG